MFDYTYNLGCNFRDSQIFGSTIMGPTKNSCFKAIHKVGGDSYDARNH